MDTAEEAKSREVLNMLLVQQTRIFRPALRMVERKRKRVIVGNATLAGERHEIWLKLADPLEILVGDEATDKLQLLGCLLRQAESATPVDLVENDHPLRASNPHDQTSMTRRKRSTLAL
jgi:hypothetical protein